ncbi:MAG: AbrB/MazE/SpoVT family DNA-binding domain-containing protein [Clostridia bacterium]|nr:AbrB/MazE/SpoVT family DNA-binding domain-containing protein [Clostridia bacterium]
MQDTGIVRRIDELGRVVIPKELRRTLRMREGDPLEIYTQNNQLIFKKYSPLASLMENASAVADGIKETTDCACMVTDTDKVLYVTDNKYKHLLDQHLSSDIDKILKERRCVVINGGGYERLSLVQGGERWIEGLIVAPIASNGDCYGAVIMVGNPAFSNAKKLVELGANFLSKQF